MSEYLVDLDLSNAEHKNALVNVTDDILFDLKNFSDNHAVIPDTESPDDIVSVVLEIKSYYLRLKSLEYLKSLNLIDFDYMDNIDKYAVDVLNRYNFEVLHEEIIDDDNKASDIPNLIYYNPKTGEGFINGNPIKLKNTLKSKHRKLFELLISKAPQHANLDEMKKAVGQDKINTPDDLSVTFSKLRSACKTDKNVISSKAGKGVINAKIFYLN